MITLTGAQLGFAQEHEAVAGSPAELDPQMVFFYRKTEFGAERWLVAPDGRVLDQAWFHYSCAD
jgi:hypothetical protein